MSGTLGDEIASIVLTTAHALARHHKLEHAGVIYCWNCSQRPALMPSLHCAACLADAWRRTGAAMQCQNREQTEDDVGACAL